MRALTACGEQHDDQLGNGREDRPGTRRQRRCSTPTDRRHGRRHREALAAQEVTERTAPRSLPAHHLFPSGAGPIRPVQPDVELLLVHGQVANAGRSWACGFNHFLGAWMNPPARRTKCWAATSRFRARCQGRRSRHSAEGCGRRRLNGQKRLVKVGSSLPAGADQHDK